MWQEAVEGKRQASHELGHPTGGVPIAFSVVQYSVLVSGCWGKLHERFK